MTKSYAQLKSEIAKLEEEAAGLREAEMTKVVAQIKESIATFGLTVETLFGRGTKAFKSAVITLGGKAPRMGAGVPKYRDPKSGKTWTGMGKPPAWIATARSRDRFLIDRSGAEAAPAKKSVGAKQTISASISALESKAEKLMANKAASLKRAGSKKVSPAKKPVAVPRSAATTSKKSAKATKTQKPAAETRGPRKSTTPSAPAVASATQDTTATAS